MATAFRQQALFASFLAGLAAAAVVMPGCSDGDADRTRGATGGQGVVALQPVTPAVHAEGTARILGSGARTRLELKVTGLPPLDEAYEVWLYNSASDSVGVARVARGSFELRTRLPRNPGRYRYVDISREPLDGNRNHSGASVLRIRVSRLLEAAGR
jgi:Anti-sigma-K factor rskA